MHDPHHHKTRAFGQTLTLLISWKRPFLSLSPGWAAVAGGLAVGLDSVDYLRFFHFVLLWLLVDVLLDTVWEIVVEQQLWKTLKQADLPAPPVRGIMIPYAQPHSAAGRGVVAARRYTKWLRENKRPVNQNLTTVLLATLLALLLAYFLQPSVFWVTILIVGLTWIAGLTPNRLSSSGGGRLQSITQFLLPWLMGMLLWSKITVPALILALCFWAVYLGGLRMTGGHRRANWLFFGGQLASIFLLLGLQQLPGAAIVFLLLVTQIMLRNTDTDAVQFLPRVQYHLFAQLIITALFLGFIQ
jgi:hypothetical protein